mmetsp:Transcript_7749/g.14422  ORF Transcript_7749/g.14422 Transcript_7749/m.14422 type:complete len:275 (-) Transcript_7749:71-895(-)
MIFVAVGAATVCIAVLALVLRVVYRSEALGYASAAFFVDTLGFEASVDSAIGEWKSKLLKKCKLSGKIMDCGSGTGPGLKYLCEEQAIREIVCIEPNPHLVGKLEQRVASMSVRNKVVSVFNGTLQEYMMKHPQEAGSFDGVVCMHSLACMGSSASIGQIIQIALSQGGKLVFLETTSVKGRGEWLQQLLRIPFIVLMGGWDLKRDVERGLRSLKWKTLITEHFEEAKMPLSRILRSHVIGCGVVAEAKGGLHRNSDQIVRRARAAYSRRAQKK